MLSAASPWCWVCGLFPSNSPSRKLSLRVNHQVNQPPKPTLLCWEPPKENKFSSPLSSHQESVELPPPNKKKSRHIHTKWSPCPPESFGPSHVTPMPQRPGPTPPRTAGAGAAARRLAWTARGDCPRGTRHGGWIRLPLFASFALAWWFGLAWVGLGYIVWVGLTI